MKYTRTEFQTRIYLLTMICFTKCLHLPISSRITIIQTLLLTFSEFQKISRSKPNSSSLVVTTFLPLRILFWSSFIYLPANSMPSLVSCITPVQNTPVSNLTHICSHIDIFIPYSTRQTGKIYQMPCLGSTKPIRNPGGGEVFPFPSAASEYLKNVVFISFPTLVHYFPDTKN